MISVMPQQRIDIQALRGFAVLIVLFYHAELGGPDSGFLGVDVFFVISGYLITSNIRNEILAGRFSFYEFYFRRAKRILPAAYVTFFVTAIVAQILLAQADLADFGKQLVGAVTFTANFVLANQSGYFDASAELKPLLHVWSLAIEEQYYLALPLVLFFTPRRFWLFVLAATLVLSFSYSQLQEDRTDAFFLIQSRAWELMIGSLGALIGGSAQLSRAIRLAFWPALVALVALPLLQPSRAHPGIDALAICVATLVVILRQHPRAGANVAIASLGRFGDFSYSLYLVHWPIFSFLEHVWIGMVPEKVRVAAVLLSLLLGYLMYVFVEQPFRRTEKPPRAASLVPILLGATLIVLSPVIVGQLRAGGTDYAYLLRKNRGLSEVCDYRNTAKDLAQCRNADDPTVMVWGDSHAMQLVSGLADSGVKLFQSTASACAPFVGVARIGGKYDRAWAERCIAFNDTVVESLKKRPSITTVVIAGQASNYISDKRNRLLVRQGDGSLIEAEPSVDAVHQGLLKTIELVRRAGKKITIVASPPFGGYDVARCAERLMSGKLLLGAPPHCDIDLARYKKLRAGVLDLYDRVERNGDLAVIWPSTFLCNDVRCQTVADGTILYRDSSHLSHGGSVALAKMMNLPELVQSLAR